VRRRKRPLRPERPLAFVANVVSPGSMVRQSDHFAAYSFVDRVVEFERGARARGTFAIPQQIDGFPAALVAEAVGQLAAWVAMDAVEFRGRPVAALATETRFDRAVQPGQQLQLDVDILSCDDDTVAYNGRASVDGQDVIALTDCLGPMLPVADFDSPDALREWLNLLRSEGATPGRFQGVAPMRVDVSHHEPGVAMRATLDVPADAPFFGDHFPRRPVFPATLLLDALMNLAQRLARDAPAMQGATPQPLRATHVKMRSFIVPSQRLELGAELAPAAYVIVKAMLSARTDDRLVASARVELVAGTTGKERP
jgi:3-hydroxymyristoyl/3-hydroxydecanoyl-(acyl carrier protein) dehydratase